MADMAAITDRTHRIAQEFHPERIILFGSHAGENPNYAAACFHAQQCVEKYIKARLIEAETPFPKTHDLSALLSLVLPV